MPYLLRWTIMTALSALIVVGCSSTDADPSEPVPPITSTATAAGQAATGSPRSDASPTATPASAPTSTASPLPSPSPTARSAGQPTEVLVTPTTTGQPAYPSPVIQAIDDLHARIGVDRTEIEVVRYEQVIWPDGSLGCPIPGMNYIQMLIEGAFIQLRVGDRTYNYHSGRTAAPVLCESPLEQLPEDLPGRQSP